jgi:hypothetical protein
MTQSISPPFFSNNGNDNMTFYIRFANPSSKVKVQKAASEAGPGAPGILRIQAGSIGELIFSLTASHGLRYALAHGKTPAIGEPFRMRKALGERLGGHTENVSQDETPAPAA